MTTIQQSMAAPEEDPVRPELRALLTRHSLAPLWESPGAPPGAPVAREAAAIWRWEDVGPILKEAARIVTPSVVERRVLQLSHPVHGPSQAAATTGLINATLQAMMPGEVARPHRHTMNALRFILEGDGAETLVDGRPFPMHPGDLILTPAMAVHEHVNRTGVPAYWLDILDFNLMRHLGTASFFPGPDGARAPAPDAAAFASPGVVPTTLEPHALPHSSLYRYPWSDVRRALAHAPAKADGSREVRYIDPLTGGACMSLMDCHVLEIPAGGTTAWRRSSASAVCSVVDGGGSSLIDDLPLSWSPRDTFTLPQHAWVRHRASADGPARLFIASNRGAYRRLGLLDEATRPD